MGKLIMLSSSIVFLLVAGLFPGTQGLECYSCYDISFLNQPILNLLRPPYNPLKHVGWKPHKSCASGRGISPDLKETCDEGVTNAENKSAIVVCAEMKLSINTSGLELPELPPIVPKIPEIVKVVARGCLHVDPDVEDPREKEECKERDFVEFTEMVLGPLKELIEDPFLNKTTSRPLQEPSTAFEVCTCNENLCAYDECEAENPPDSCHSSENPNGSTGSTECTGDNCGTAQSINNAKMSVLAFMFVVSLITLY